MMESGGPVSGRRYCGVALGSASDDVWTSKVAAMVTPAQSLGRRRPGEVRDAIERVLTDAAKPLSVKEIHESIEARLGSTVPASSVRSYLNLNAGRNGQFRRVRRGVYKLG